MIDKMTISPSKIEMTITPRRGNSTGCFGSGSDSTCGVASISSCLFSFKGSLNAITPRFVNITVISHQHIIEHECLDGECEDEDDRLDE